MSQLTTDLAAILAKARRPGDFYASGAIETFPPGLMVHGVGDIALPLLPVQAQQIIAEAAQAPFGRGPDTVFDPSVRRTWQIEPAKVKIASKHWPQTIQSILARVAEGLGVAGAIEAELYKLLVYDEGSFFVSHRDTEKSRGMFATLVIVLPSISQGGELVVRHGGREAKLDLSTDDASEIAFAAFYADCVHEVLPVTSGYRLALIYNLVRQSKRGVLAPPNHDREVTAAAGLLAAWAASGDAPTKLIYPLEYAYTRAELGFAAMKGADSAVASVLVQAARQADCDLHLAMITIEESGAAEYSDSPRLRRDRWSEPEFEAGEVFERSQTLSQWRRPDGAPSSLSELPIEEGEVSPPASFEDMVPDEEHFQEHAGNEGASFERSYSRAALVLWPRRRLFEVVNQAGRSATLPLLTDMANQWNASGEDRRSSFWRDAQELSQQISRTWPTDKFECALEREESDAGRFLAALTRLGDEARIVEFVTRVIVAGAFENGDNPALVSALQMLPTEKGGDLLFRVIAGTSAATFDRAAGLLVRAAASPRLGTPAQRVAAARALVVAMPAQMPESNEALDWCEIAEIEPRCVVDLIAGLTAINCDIANEAVAFALARPQIYKIDDALVPAACELYAKTETRDHPAVLSLRSACLAHLRARISQTLEPPADFRRDNAVGCKCAHCAELGAFLTDPARGVWRFRAAQSSRSHVEQSIKNAHADIEWRTEKQGSPHLLICTKNQASYKRRLEQREGDIASVTALA